MIQHVIRFGYASIFPQSTKGEQSFFFSNKGSQKSGVTFLMENKGSQKLLGDNWMVTNFY